MAEFNFPPVRFGVIGVSGIGSEHLKQLEQLNIRGEAVVVAVADVQEQAARAVSIQYQCDWYLDYKKMLSRRDIEAVMICAPSGLHGDITINAARAGKHVIVEKPMEISIQKAEEMVQVCEEEGVMLSVIYQNRFADDVMYLNEALRHGRFGQNVLINGAVYWYRSQQYYDGSAWRGTWAMDGGGAVMNQGIHTLDLILHLFGDYKSIRGYTACLGHERIEVEDLATSVLEFQSGALGVFSTTTCAYPGFDVRIEIIGSEGTAILEDNKLTLDVCRDRDMNSPLKESVPKQSYRGLDLHGRQHHNVIQAIRGFEQLKVDGKEGLKALYAIDELYQGRLS
ncbi:Gfo/Idh/MocA family oxidoreductase [Alkalihalobacillus macyae]|uniref:Gfo/Idh/MocA family protein n=1 Tax=Guptibacillus hwajinpoensis TaxID=208199 RepID=UPI00273CBC7C|nr:Gfo/Idh/MocA family oxidoreductase [Alkalihalobacillus macyae]MDP4551113.1 Gfo/Idh/MocA family oxidoreductase [Alkalihalobacillus macyae]